ncbi:Rho GTPase activation protein [Cokeromyces recurvatus]|uniref:Rho GTPase activation protein n=1 Tax=Cokeromyces recurvatus TaxID=90255 RepID=UPI0022204A0A|nr:Rho GTPase activation protein [Cokeromyces recurvatus]KAI7903019.1 Rho GTPase activation protein [Cokeromyces recurvatus]
MSETLTTSSSIASTTKKRHKSHSFLKDISLSANIHNKQLPNHRYQHHLSRSTSDSGTKQSKEALQTATLPTQYSNSTLHRTTPDNHHASSTNSFLFNFGLKSSRKQSTHLSSKEFCKGQQTRSLSTTVRPLKNFLTSSKSTYSRLSIISSPTNNPEAAIAMNPLKKHSQHVTSITSSSENLISTKPILPVGLQQDITRFAMNGFAQKYFSTHKKGLFRRRVPMAKMLKWTKDPIKQPLIMLNKDLYKDALRCFKMIQTIMGDRPPHKSLPRPHNVIEDIQSILSCGITKGQMRDEIYVQVCKQLNNNPNGDSIRKGWEILCIISTTFPPSKNLETYLTSFVEQNHAIEENHVGIISQHVSTKLKRACIRGAKGKVLTIAEIQRAKEAPFKPSVFGESLSFIINLQKDTSSLQIPQIVPFLTNAVLQANGKYSEGIFRVPGDADAVTDLRIKIENGHYDAIGVTDPNVPASLLKYWLRDLAEPIIPSKDYEDCIQFAEDAEKATTIINRLPDTNRRIILFIISFLQEFTSDPAIIKNTLMNVNNLAMVFAPNFLRCPSESLTTVFENSKYEQAFLRTLINQMVADADACAYDPDNSKAIGILLQQ